MRLPHGLAILQELGVSEFVLSNELVIMALAMVAENLQTIDILKELFTAEGNEFYIFPASRYLHDGETLNFYQLLVRGRQKLEVGSAQDLI